MSHGSYLKNTAVSAAILFSFLNASSIHAQSDGSAPASSPSEDTSVATLSSLVSNPDGVQWSSLPDNTRYLMLMGSIDGLHSALGRQTLSFPASDMESIDKLISERSGGNVSPEDLVSILSEFSGESGEMTGVAYTTALFKDMNEEHIGIYSKSVISAWRSSSKCKIDSPDADANRVAERLRESEDLSVMKTLESTLKEFC